MRQRHVYQALKFWNDARALYRGRIMARIVRRVVGKLVGRGMGKWL